MSFQRTRLLLIPTIATAILLCGLLTASTQLTAQADRSSSVGLQQPYKIIDRWKIGGDGGWDYLLADPPAHRLYLTHGARVEVLDTQTGKSVGTIANLHGTHGIALDTAGKFGYISDGGGNAVVVFDRAMGTNLQLLGLEAEQIH